MRITALPAALVLAAALCGGTSACRDKGAPPSAASGASKSRPLTLAVIPMGTTHEFWKAIHAGALTAARELGVEIIWKGPFREDDRNEQVQIVETLTNAGVDAIILTPMDDRALVPPVEEAARAGIPTVIFNSALSGGSPVAFIATDNYKGGVLAARAGGRAPRRPGEGDPHPGIEGVEGTTKRGEGFLGYLRAKFPGIRILSDNRYAGVTTETAYQTAENLINRFADVDAIFTPNESSTFGCLRALEDHGLGRQESSMSASTPRKSSSRRWSSGRSAASSSRTRSGWATRAWRRRGPPAGPALREDGGHGRLPGHARKTWMTRRSAGFLRPTFPSWTNDLSFWRLP